MTGTDVEMRSLVSLWNWRRHFFTTRSQRGVQPTTVGPKWASSQITSARPTRDLNDIAP